MDAEDPQAATLSCIADELRGAAFFVLESKIKRGCEMCGAPMYRTDPGGLKIPLGVVVLSFEESADDTGILCQKHTPLCFACADKLGIDCKKGA